MRNQPNVKVWLSGHISIGRQPLVRARAKLAYDPNDPYAVHIAITTRRSRPVEWVFARDLLMLGTTESSGTGDVVVAPAPEPFARKTLVALGASSDAAVLILRTREVRKFLWHSYELVPSGREEHHLDVDELVTQLLAA